MNGNELMNDSTLQVSLNGTNPVGQSADVRRSYQRPVLAKLGPIHGMVQSNPTSGGDGCFACCNHC